MRVSVLSSPRRRSWLRRILRRFRRNGTRQELGSGTPHAAMNLLPVPFAFTGMRALSMPIQATGTTGAISFYFRPGHPWGDGCDPTAPVRVNKPTGPGSSGIAMEEPGGSGGQLGRADFTNRGDE